MRSSPQKKFVVLSIFLMYHLVFTGCTFHKTNSGVTIIEGNIAFPKNDKIYFFSYPDSIALYTDRMSAMDSCTMDEKGNFRFQIHSRAPLVFSLVNGNRSLVSNLFISPGDNIRINFEGSHQVPEIISSGNASEYNTYLLNFQETFFLDSAARYEYYILSNYLDLRGFTQYNETRKQKQLELFKKNFKDDSLDKAFSDYALNSIHYGIAVDRLVYLWKKRMKGEHVTADSSFFSFETPSFIENKNALTSPSYIHFLNLYIKDSYERMVERGEFPVNQIPAVAKAKLAKQLLNPPYRDIVLINVINDDMHDVSGSKAAHDHLSPDSMLAWFNRKYLLQ